MNVNYTRILLYCLLTSGTDKDAEKFEYVYEKYKALAYHCAFGITGDKDLAEDAVSETFIRVYRNLGKIEEGNAPRTAGFIAVIAKNCAKTIAKRNGLISFDETPQERADDFNLENSVLDKITAQQITAAADALSDDLKAVFLLKYAYDMSNKEIARALNITVTNAGVLAHRAKKRLIKLITGGKSNTDSG